MSVVNRMLLDIDRRHPAATGLAAESLADTAATPLLIRPVARQVITRSDADTGHLQTPQQPQATEEATHGPTSHTGSWSARSKAAILGLFAVVLMMAAALLVWPARYSLYNPTPGAQPPSNVPRPAVASVVKAFPPITPLTPAPAATLAAPVETPVASSTPSVNPPSSHPPTSTTRLTASPLPPVSPVPTSMPATSPPARQQIPTTAAPTSHLKMTTVLEPTAVPAVPTSSKAASEEPIRVARLLWQEQSRNAALHTLREALGAAEATHQSLAVPALARELARLEIADSQYELALDRLKRLEPRLADDAECWALRGHAAQRLTLHSEAATAYQTALRLKPGESRWMLSAAISLAAEGQKEIARRWVDLARNQGSITPEVSAYLLQLGIWTP